MGVATDFRSASGPIYITGGRQKPRQLDEWKQYEAGVILRLDPRSGCITKVVEYTSPPEVSPDDDASSVFKAASLVGKHLYVCTNTEILVYDTSSFHRVGYLSSPLFNDVHHVVPTPNGNFLVASTGLDLVVELTPSGEVVREWSVLGEGDVWQRFSREIDYRKVPTTKPHCSHPNFVIQSGKDVWVSRFIQQDVICLTEPNRRVQMRGTPHDGVRLGGRLYFTTVDSYIHIVNEETMTVEDVVDLNAIDQRGINLGWARGILPLNEALCWVAFSRLRPTKFNLSWVKHGFSRFRMPTRLALYDFQERKLLHSVELDTYGMDAVFSLVTEPAEA